MPPPSPRAPSPALSDGAESYWAEGYGPPAVSGSARSRSRSRSTPRQRQQRQQRAYGYDNGGGGSGGCYSGVRGVKAHAPDGYSHTSYYEYVSGGEGDSGAREFPYYPELDARGDDRHRYRYRVRGGRDRGRGGGRPMTYSEVESERRRHRRSKRGGDLLLLACAAMVAAAVYFFGDAEKKRAENERGRGGRMGERAQGWTDDSSAGSRSRTRSWGSRRGAERDVDNDRGNRTRRIGRGRA
ncbi:hypothetical protein MKZ38_001152 [Zalerion maritima]|uniref:Uncharacterized protein n=1 Tax=Zalerion maritima TaxID=339359 RepID=A0AAD5WS35_9PEZI|nr:hypothetical protein MKZ38_001152 [Zalerion maritima]